MPEALFFEPKAGRFDTARVSGFLSKLGHPVEDASTPGRFLVFADPDEAARYRARRQTDAAVAVPFVCIIAVQPALISVSQLCDQPGLVLARRFVEWLLANFDCTVEDDEGEDLTGVAIESLYAES